MRTLSLRKHPWLLAAPLVLLCVTLVDLEIAQAQSLVGGNAVIDRTFVDSFDNFSLVDTNNPINMNGQVTAFEVFAGTTQPVTLVIYRQTGPGPVFSVVGTSGQETPILGFNQFQLTTPIQVQAGDFVGLVNSSVEFDLDPPGLFSLGNLSGTMLFSNNNAGLTTNFVGSSNRTYSVRVIAATTQVCVQPPEGIVSWLPGDGNANDIADANHGTLQDGATFGTGLVGQAFSFDGTNDLVNVPASSVLNIQSAITLDAWILSASVPTQIDVIHGRPFGYQLVTRPDGNLRFAFPIVGVSGVSQNVDSASTVPAMTWIHVAATYDSASGTASIYINGVLEGTHITSGQKMPSQNKPLQIGGFSDPGFVGGFFNGLIDEVGIFNRALSTSEIQAIFNAGSAGKCKVTTVTIDIKPGSFPNRINLRSKGVIPVAVLTTATFDATP